MLGGHLDRRLSVCPFRDAQNYDGPLEAVTSSIGSIESSSTAKDSRRRRKKMRGITLKLPWSILGSSPWLSRPINE